MKFSCQKCVFKGINEEQLRKHVDYKLNLKESRNVIEEFNCMEYDFQGSTEMQLRKHINIKHTFKDKVLTIKCRNCEEEFSEKWNLMLHRKSNHSNTIRICRNFEIGNCYYTAESCWWIHGESNIMNKVQCFICSETFDSKYDMMIHRKKSHSNHIKQCNKFLQGSCQFQESFCWYNHEKQRKGRDMESETNLEEEDDTSSVFQDAVKNPKPPSASSRQNPENRN